MEQQQVFFSIVIPTYNRGDLIASTVASILAQTYSNFELIIVDDGGTDNTDQVIAGFHDSRVSYVKKTNEERAAARNFGVRMSKGDYITFVDSDDLLKENHLEVAYRFIKDNSSPFVFHLGYDVVYPDGKILYPWKTLPDPANEKLIEGNYLSCLGVFLKRDVALENQFNEYRPLSGSGEDYELWLRLAARYPIRTCPTRTANLVNHDSRGVLLFDSETLLKHSENLRKCWAQDPQVSEFIRPRRDKLYAFLDLYVALHLAMARYRFQALRTLIGCVRLYPPILFKYRFLVVIKKLLWF